MLRSFESVLEEGREFGKANPAFYATELAKGGADDIADDRLHLGHDRHAQGRDAQPSQHDRDGRGVRRGERRSSAATTGCPICRWRWVGDAAFTLGMALVARLTANCPENPETVQRDLRELGPDAMLAPPRIWENMLTLMQIKGSDASPLKRGVFEYFRGAGRALRAEAQRRQAAVAGRPPGPRGGRDPGLRPGARPARPRQGALVLHRRRAARSRHLPLLPVVRHQPQAGLRRHRGVGADRLPGRRRGQSQHGRPADSRARGQDRRSRRGHAQGRQCLHGLLQAGRGDARRP